MALILLLLDVSWMLMRRRGWLRRRGHGELPRHFFFGTLSRRIGADARALLAHLSARGTTKVLVSGLPVCSVVPTARGAPPPPGATTGVKARRAWPPRGRRMTPPPLRAPWPQLRGRPLDALPRAPRHPSHTRAPPLPPSRVPRHSHHANALSGATLAVGGGAGRLAMR